MRTSINYQFSHSANDSMASRKRVSGKTRDGIWTITDDLKHNSPCDLIVRPTRRSLSWTSRPCQGMDACAVNAEYKYLANDRADRLTVSTLMHRGDAMDDPTARLGALQH